jgi:hypothetical protein
LSGPPLQLDPLIGLPAFATDSHSQAKQSSPVRLPTNVVPSHYTIEIRPIVDKAPEDPQQFTAPGRVEIRLRCVTASQNITLHADEIEIDHEKVEVRKENHEIMKQSVNEANLVLA